jgi:hypothetical protein
MRTRTRQTSPAVRQRRDLLEGVGFSTLDAHRLARDPRYDALALIELVGDGFPPALALRMLEATADEGSAA